MNRDARHSGVLVVSEGPADERVFPTWSMGFRTLTPDEQRNLGEIDLSRQALRDRLGADAPVILKTMMARFYEVTYPLSAEVLAAE